MAIVFDANKIAKGDPVRIAFTETGARDIAGNVGGIFETDITVFYLLAGHTKAIVIEAEDIDSGAIDFRWMDDSGVWRHYPDDDLVYDDGSGGSGGGGGGVSKTYVDNQDTATLNTAKAYTDTGDTSTLNTAKAYADAGDTTTLNTAKAYADTKARPLTKQEFWAAFEI
jgi:hypothetical protein